MNTRRILIILSILANVSLLFFAVYLSIYSESDLVKVSVFRIDTELGSGSQLPINSENLLDFSFNINRVNTILNDAIDSSDIDLPRVQVFDKEGSYTARVVGDKPRSWIEFDERNLRIYLFDDIASLLTEEEVLAYSVHEIGHEVLGHLKGLQKRTIPKEKEADKWAVQAGIDPMILISALEKIPSNNIEKRERIIALRLHLY